MKQQTNPKNYCRTKISRLVTSIVLSLIALVGAYAQTVSYCVPEGIHNVTARSERYLKSIVLTGATAEEAPVSFTKDISPTGNRTNVYYDKTSEVLNATAGDKLVIKWTKSSDLTWMHYYAYIDYNQDGVFDEATEAVAYTYYKGRNSKGQTVSDGADLFVMPEFTIPQNALKGSTRLRIKCDWDCLNPCENTEAANYLYKNGGSIVDFTIRILPKTQPVLTIVQPDNGVVTVADDQGHAVTSGASVEAGTKLLVTAIPNDGLHLKHLLINDEPYKSFETYIFKDLKISALFTADWNLQYAASEGGKWSVTRKSDGTPLSTDIDLIPGTEVNVTLHMENNYEVKSITLDGKSAKELFTEANHYTATLKMTKDLSLAAELIKKQFAVTLNQTGKWGVLNIDGYSAPSKGEPISIESGTEITINAVPDECEEAWVESFTVNGEELLDQLTASSNYTYTMTITTPTTIDASFAIHLFTVNAQIIGKGKVALFDTNRPTTEYILGEPYPINTEISLRLIPDEGWVLESLDENGKGVDVATVKDGVHELGLLLEDYTYDVTFKSKDVGVANPTANEIQMSYSNGMLFLKGCSLESVCTILDLTGKYAMRVSGSNNIDVSALENGCYLVKVVDTCGEKVLKFIKR